MRLHRLKLSGMAYYHVINRIHGGEFLISQHERERILMFIRKAEGFCGAQVLTFAVMSNHFHLLVRTDPPHEVDDEELVRRMGCLYDVDKLDEILEQWKAWDEAGQCERTEKAKKAMRARMFDLSQFVKTFKELYAMDYNRRTEHVCSVFGGQRFKSVVVEPTYRAMMTVGTYIDLNPVRAGVVDDPVKSTWNALGKALLKDGHEREGLLELVRVAYNNRKLNWETARDVYLKAIDGTLVAEPRVREKGTRPPVRLCPHFTDEQLREAAQLSDSAPIERKRLLRLKVHQFSHGRVLGSDEFVAKVKTRCAAEKGSTSQPFWQCADMTLRNGRRMRGPFIVFSELSEESWRTFSPDDSPPGRQG